MQFLFVAGIHFQWTKRSSTFLNKCKDQRWEEGCWWERWWWGCRQHQRDQRGEWQDSIIIKGNRIQCQLQGTTDWADGSAHSSSTTLERSQNSSEIIFQWNVDRLGFLLQPNWLCWRRAGDSAAHGKFWLSFRISVKNTQKQFRSVISIFLCKR